jgi:hypothetical protein
VTYSVRVNGRVDDVVRSASERSHGRQAWRELVMFAVKMRTERIGRGMLRFRGGAVQRNHSRMAYLIPVTFAKTVAGNAKGKKECDEDRYRPAGA